MKASRYLFLQGQISRFFSDLGLGLHRRGHPVHRINFNRGDRRFWRLPGSLDFTGTAAEWPAFLAGQCQAWGITDLILFGDCRPLHVAAIRMARERGIAVHVFEEGYLRPDYVTLEAGGVNGHSTLPRDAQSYLDAAATLPPWSAGTAIPASFSRRAWDDVSYNSAAVLGGWRFPHYRSHRAWHPFVEYAVGARRFPLKLWRREKTLRRACALWEGKNPYFLFPLQLDADSQIRFHAPAGGMLAAIDAVMRSFAAHAPSEALLVITEHPLDYGPVDLPRVVAQRAASLGLGARVICLRGGSPAALVQGARGLVTVNSTIGISALAAQVPVITLGKAIYNLPGLTAQQGIDAFWQQPTAPDATLFDAFRRVVAARTQINGGFHSDEGIALAVAGAIEKLEQRALPVHAVATPTAAGEARGVYEVWPLPPPVIAASTTAA